MPLATTVLHTGILEKAGLITTERRPARRGTQKVCTRVYDTVLVQLPERRQNDLTVLEQTPALIDVLDTTCTSSGRKTAPTGPARYRAWPLPSLSAKTS